MSSTEELTLLVDRLLTVDLGGSDCVVDPAVALERARLLLLQAERVQAAALLAVAEVDRRELHLLDACGSTRGWLRTLPCGDTGQLGQARRLCLRPHVQGALSTGLVSVAGAAKLCAALEQVDVLGSTDDIGEDQLLGTLVHGVSAMLEPWIGARLDAAAVRDVHRARRTRLREILTGCVEDITADPASRLEPALVLLAEALPPTSLTSALGRLLDALQPEQLDADAADQQQETSWSLKRRSGGGWVLHSVLDDETGARLDAEVRARTKAAERAAAKVAAQAAGAAQDTGADAAADVDPGTAAPDAAGGQTVAEPTGALGEAVLPFIGQACQASQASQASDAFGTIGPGLPQLPPLPMLGLFPVPDRQPVEGPVRRRPEHYGVDALRILLDDLAGVTPGSGSPSAAQLTVVTGPGVLTGEPAAPLAQLDTALGPITLSPEVARRLGCGADLATVTFDDSGNPIGASGSHRHATRRERRALRAMWGSTCGVNGCTSPGAIPHHVEPWWKTHATRLADLLPICAHHHHDVHEGHKTLRLRDGRLIGPSGWMTSLPVAA